MFENGDYGFYNDDLQEAYLHMAQYYAKHGDSNKALTNLDLAADCAIAFIEFAKCGNYEHTAIAVSYTHLYWVLPSKIQCRSKPLISSPISTL